MCECLFLHVRDTFSQIPSYPHSLGTADVALKLATNCKRNSKKIFFLDHSVAFKCHLDALQFIAVRSRTSISVIFLHFHILMTYSDCAFLKPFCKCTWLTDVHLKKPSFVASGLISSFCRVHRKPVFKFAGSCKWNHEMFEDVGNL